MTSGPTMPRADSAALQTGEITPLELVERCLATIERHEPVTAAWVLVDADSARRQAVELGEELRQGRRRGPLHGLPIGVKDIIDVAGWPTRAGSPLRVRHVAERDATVVARLRAAGAILLGKTVTTELACFDPPPTRNPWNPARTPGGSSSGSAAAVALGMCPAALGSQTGGSITRPATYCGIAGCKPSFGRVSRAGVVPVSEHLDHVGPMAARVSDLATMLSAMSGPDPLDPATLEQPPLALPLPLAAGSPPVLAVPKEFLVWADAEASREFARACNVLRSAGATIREISQPPDFGPLHSHHRRIMAAEAAHLHRRDFAAHRDLYGPKLAGLLDEGLAVRPDQLHESLAHQACARAAADDLLHVHPLLLTPATSTAAPGIESTGDPVMNSPWSYLGLPTVSLPSGLSTDGLPLGLQLVGPRYGEAELLPAALWCESVLQFRLAPKLIC